MTNTRAVLVGLAIVASLIGASYGSVNGAPGETSRVRDCVFGESATDSPLLEAYSLLTVTTDKNRYLPGEQVNITATFPVGYSGTFPTSLTMYYMILDSDGRVLYDMKKHVYVLMVITFWSVGPGYSRSFIWNQLDDNGTPVGFPKWLQAVVVVPAWANPVSASSEFEVDPIPASFDLTLVSGWNLVSMPLLNDTWSANGIGLVTGSIVVEWDALSQSYSNEFIVGATPEAWDFGLIAGRSYFVWVHQDQTITLRGCSPEVFGQYSVGLDVPAAGGWTCVGFNSLGPGLHASDIDPLVAGANTLVVCMWDPDLAAYETYIPGVTPPSHDFVIGPGNGCWLCIDGPGTLTYSP